MEFIAEFCQNHNGDFEILKDMVYQAKESGAAYAKIQNIFADMLAFRPRFETGIQENGIVKTIKRPYEPEHKRLKKLELSYQQQVDFIDLCKKVGIKPLTTVFTQDTVEKLKEIGFEDIKIASYDCASLPLLEKAKDTFSKVILSTGATFDHEIEEAAKLLAGSDFSFLHCVTIYPTPLEEFHLARLSYLKQFTSAVGWSDHSLVKRDGMIGTMVAVYYGASIIERHFTILAENQTKDGPISVRPEHVKELVAFARLSKENQKEYLLKVFPDFKKCLGKENRILSPIELLNRDYYRGRFASKQGGKTIYNWEILNN